MHVVVVGGGLAVGRLGEKLPVGRVGVGGGAVLEEPILIVVDGVFGSSGGGAAQPVSVCVVAVGGGLGAVGDLDKAAGVVVGVGIRTGHS